MTTTETFMLRADDGVEIAVHRWLPAGKPRGIVQIAHGMAEHGKRYARLAQQLNDAGWAVYASDHRGHGLTAKTDAEVGHFCDEDGWNRVIADLRMIAQHARREHPGVPYVLFGHSMGSFLAQTLVLRHPQELDALVLSGSTAGGGPLVAAGKQAAKLERIRVGKRGTSPLLTQLSFGSYNRGFEGRTKYDWLSRDPVEVDLYCADARCGFEVTTQTWIDLLGALEELGRGQWSRLPRELPILVFAGELDPVGERGKGVRRLVDTMRKAGLGRVTDRLYPAGRHEMINETNRDEVMGSLVRWLDEHVPRA
ncbi:alpha/beta hydrolase [Sandaracinus amylolyticus]|uniref:Lysophospholipase n=1 Tax=Sandaracinus amylolyticus TaxID=927083 RepID=A0A0F6SHD2_9BACT|nr:alpha/beta hydrolase [Sandaracinus amylolyticus]AKF10239.1 Lysophospholipase [Sandaracinus amylolyticus]